MALLQIDKLNDAGAFTAFRGQLFIPPHRVVGPRGFGFQAVIYQCYMKTDWDGSHRGYGLDRPDEGAYKFPFQKNLRPHEAGEKLWRSGRSKANNAWAGVVSKNETEARDILRLNYPRWNAIGPDEREKVYRQFHDTRSGTPFGSLQDSTGRFPIVQIPDSDGGEFNGRKENFGYYVSQAHAHTSEADYRKRPWDQRVYLDAAKVPYSVVPKGRWAMKGDVGLVIRNSTGASTPFFFGDTAGENGATSLGECSGCVLNILGGKEYTGAEGPNEEAYSFIVFPLSGNGKADNVAAEQMRGEVWARMQRLAKPFGGLPARELAVRLAGSENYVFHNIGRAFTYYGLNVFDSKSSVAQSADDDDYQAPPSLHLPGR